MSLLSREGIKDMAYPEWLIEGIVPASAVSMLYGRSGTGKSFLGVDMAGCVTTGHKWNGRTICKQGPVVYVAGEGRSGYRSRIEAWEQRHGEYMADFHLRDEPVRLWRNPASLEKFISEVDGAGVQPVAVILDTLSNCLGGADDRDNGQMRELLDSAEELVRHWDAAVLLVHHTPKVGESPRGAQTLQDGVAMHCYLTGDGKTYGLLTCTKQKDDREFEPIRRELRRIPLPGGLNSLAFSDAYKTGPRDASRVRVSWPEIRAFMARSDIPVTPAMVAANFPGMENDAAQMALARAEQRREVVSERGAYCLVGSPLATLAA